MMIRLSKISEHDYENYLSFAIEEYANDKVAAGTWGAEEAIKLAKEEWDNLLPKGLQTSNHYFYTIIAEEEEKRIGFLWFFLAKNGAASKLFIYDFFIEESFRNLGYGKRTLAVLDDLAQELEVTQIDLHVFAHNKTALHLYEQSGFIATDVSMSKKLPTNK